MLVADVILRALMLQVDVHHGMLVTDVFPRALMLQVDVHHGMLVADVFPRALMLQVDVHHGMLVADVIERALILQVDVHHGMLVADVIQRALMEKNLSKYRVCATSTLAELDVHASAALLSMSRHLSIDDTHDPPGEVKGQFTLVLRCCRCHATCPS